MTGGSGFYRRIEVDLAAAQQLIPPLLPEEAGIGVILRHEGALVGFALRAREELAEGQIDPEALVDDGVRTAIAAETMRRRLGRPSAPARRLSVGICTKDGAARVARLLDSLLPLRADVPFEILVIDNAPSDDSTLKVAASRDGVRYVAEPLVGLDFARNRAVREATGDVLCFLDDDVTVDAGWARAMSDAWAANPDVGCITGLVLPMELETEAQVLFERAGGFRRGFLPLRYGSTNFCDPVHPTGAGKFGAGANMSVDLGLVRRLGGFDEALDTGRPLPGGGDLDIFARVLRAGGRLVYEPQAAVFHEHRRNMDALGRQYRSWGLGLMAFVAKTWGADPEARPALRRLVMWWFLWMVGRLRRSRKGTEPVPAPMIRAELWSGVKGLFGEYRRSQQRSDRIRRGAS